MDVSGFGFWQVLGIIALCILGVAVVAFLYDMHRNKRNAAQEAAAIKASPAGQAAITDAAALKTWLGGELTLIHGKLNAILNPPISASALPQPPIIGATFVDQFDLVRALGGLPNSIVIDGNQVFSGTQPVLTFKTVPAVAPATQSTMVRES